MAFGKERLMQLYICVVDVPVENFSWHNEKNSLDVDSFDLRNVSVLRMSPGLLVEKFV